MTETFTCARCGSTFDKNWTDDEAMAEYRRTFGPTRYEGPLAMICDDCHRDFLEWWRTVYQKRQN